MPKKTELSRQERKAKRRATEDQIPDVPLGLESDSAGERSRALTLEKAKKRKRDDADETAETSIEGRSKKTTRAKKSNKDPNHERSPVESVSTVLPAESTSGEKMKGDPAILEIELPPKKRKKERKAESRASKLAAALPADQTDCDSVPKEAAVTGESSSKPKNNRNREKKRKAAAAQAAQVSEGKPARFIVFVGNLPFTATTASITKHFAKLKPLSVRNLTHKSDPQKSRGMAFVEFASYDTHKTALKVMHHSSFDDGISEPRKINVELTAGGGGNKDGRQAKIKNKNERLDEQRQRRVEEEAKAKITKAKSSGVTTVEREKNAIHPSRQNLVSV